MTQKELILKHLISGKSITQRKAMYYYNIIRLSGVIWYLRRDGHDIETENRTNYQNNKTHAVYSLNIMSDDEFHNHSYL